MLIKKTMYKDMWMKNVSAISVNRACCGCQPLWPPPASTVSPEGTQGGDNQAAPKATRVSAAAAVSRGGPRVLAPPLLLQSSLQSYPRGCLSGLSSEKVLRIKHNFSTFRLGFSLFSWQIFTARIWEETTCPSTEMYKQIEVYAYNGTQLSSKKELKYW